MGQAFDNELGRTGRGLILRSCLQKISRLTEEPLPCSHIQDLLTDALNKLHSYIQSFALYN